MDKSISSKTANCLEGRKPELSIIIPVYNVEEYLRVCVDSVLQQTFTDFELILIDDGSSDKSGQICDEYSVKDNRVHVIHQENAGVSSARNAGLAYASGEYISFVDADDCINFRMYEILLETMKSATADLGICGVDIIKKNADIKQINYKNSTVITWSASECVSHLFDMPPVIYNSCCNKLFRKSLIKTRFDSTIKIYEDAKFLTEYLTYSQKVVHLPDYKLYIIRNREGSATRSDKRTFVESLKTRYEICLLVKNKFPERYSKAMHCYYDWCVYTYNIVKWDKKSRKQVEHILRKNLKGAMLNKTVPFKLKVVYLLASIPKLV